MRQKYWKKILGIELFKVRYYLQWFLYRRLGIKLPKLAEQRSYWKDRGTVYMDEILASGYLEREIFFQDMLMDHLGKTRFDSFFEAGCGFGWNVGRVKTEFPEARVGGLDFSLSQLKNSHDYLQAFDIDVVNGDNCSMPYKDNAFDVGFSLGVFMNIHPSKIEAALREMIRVSRKQIIHIEYDENCTTPELREKRAFKTNIVSHDYKKLYEDLGAKVVRYSTYREFGKAYNDHQEKIDGILDRWEGFEGAEKYVFAVVTLD